MTVSSTASRRAMAEAVLCASQEGPPLASCTVISAPTDLPELVGAKMLVMSDGDTMGALSPGALDASVIAAAGEIVARHGLETLSFTSAGERLEGRRAVESAATVVEVLVEVVEPAPTLLVVGAGHVGNAIAEIGARLGMSVAVLDDREDFANTDNLPFADRVICGDFEKELDRFVITANTAVVMVSRGHKVDEVSLGHVIGRGAGYVGMIGSKRRTTTVLTHLKEQGLDATELDRVFTPVGLDIGAETPAEIALAVLAEIVLVRRSGSNRRGSSRPLSDHGRTIAASGTQ